jgi:rsbT co-antagonist protein RsbR
MGVFQQVIKSNEGTILAGWMAELESSTRRSDLMNDAELRRQGTEMLRLFTAAVQSSSDVQSESFGVMREFLSDAAKSRMEGIHCSGDGPVRTLLEAAGIRCAAQFSEGFDRTPW